MTLCVCVCVCVCVCLSLSLSFSLSLSLTLSPLLLFLSLSLFFPLPFLSVKQRLPTEEGMSCAEFLYPIFQAFDFLHLHRQHNCWIQASHAFNVSGSYFPICSRFPFKAEADQPPLSLFLPPLME